MRQRQLDFNEVFFTDVRVPAENLVGELNGGWRVANGSLGHERIMLWMGLSTDCDELTSRFPPVEVTRAGSLRDLGDGLQALRLLGSAALARAARRERDVPGVSVLKVLGSEAEQNAARHALDAAGVEGMRHPVLTAPYNAYSPDLFTGSWFARYIGTYAGTIAGGTSEIQRNIIAQRILGLP